MADAVPVTEYAFTVKQLIEKLREQPEDRRVVLAIDSEGNGFTPVCDVSVSLWDQHPEHAWVGEAYSDDPEDYDFDPGWDDVSDLPRVAVIEPLN